MCDFIYESKSFEGAVLLFIEVKIDRFCFLDINKNNVLFIGNLKNIFILLYTYFHISFIFFIEKICLIFIRFFYTTQ